MLSATAQEYLETIYNITVEGDSVVNARLAEKYGVSAPSVTEMLHRLERDGYVVLDRAIGPQLTEAGNTVAEASLRRHRLAERFLADILQMDWIAAHEQAHAMQNALTPEIEARIVAVLGNPTTCPHGNPIPGSAPRTRDFLRAHQAVRLSAAECDTPLRVLCISEVVEDETALLRSVGEKGLRPGVGLRLREIEPGEAGLVAIELAGQRVSLDRTIAEKIWVSPPD
jgi:DtxR family transcriptional regulator, Mn-dependent transcriptional regulator